MRVEALILESQHADRGPAQVSREFFFLFHAPPFRICPASRGKSIPGFIVRVRVCRGKKMKKPPPSPTHTHTRLLVFFSHRLADGA